MWPFSDVSLPSATWWSDIANYVLLVCLFGGVLATFVIVRTTNVKEHHWDVLRDQSRERIAGLEAETEKAKAEVEKAYADIAKANAEIADAKRQTATLEKEAAQARAEQEQLRSQLAWRRLTRQQHDAIADAIRPHRLAAPLEVAYPLGDAEAATFSAEVIRALRDGGIAIAGDAADAVVWMPTPPFGIVLALPGTLQVVHPIARASENAGGLSVTIEFQSPTLKLIIGSKPAPF